MAIYLLKITLIWVILLALYELLYRKSPAYTLNRVYLLAALIMGVLLPFIPLSLPANTNTNYGIGQIDNGLQNFGQAVAPAAPAAEATGPAAGTILLWLYLSGAIIFLVLSLREVILILRTAIYGQYTTIGSYRIFSSSRTHAPFSFMGWVFISDPALYDEKGLEYIFRHEEAHNRCWHWLDMILMQLFFVVFWFHPLVWRFRYLLKLNHEYEADRYAAHNNTYEYGHFLLQQTLLKGTPAIAHSFHFSPIKNRIHMLTQTGRQSKWKYLFTLPLLLACGILFAKPRTDDQRVRTGNKTTFRGHEFTWEDPITDSVLVEDPETKQKRMMVAQRDGGLSKMDGDSLYDNEEVRITQAQFRYNNQDFRGYIVPLLEKELPDSIRSISLSNIVIDESGKLCYYDISCSTNSGRFYSSYDADARLKGFFSSIDKIIGDSPAWLPALSANRKIKVLIRYYPIYDKQRTTSK